MADTTSKKPSLIRSLSGEKDIQRASVYYLALQSILNDDAAWPDDEETPKIRKTLAFRARFAFESLQKVERDLDEGSLLSIFTLMRRANKVKQTVKALEVEVITASRGKTVERIEYRASSPDASPAGDNDGSDTDSGELAMDPAATTMRIRLDATKAPEDQIESVTIGKPGDYDALFRVDESERSSELPREGSVDDDRSIKLGKTQDLRRVLQRFAANSGC